VEVVSLIYSSGLVLKVQLPVALFNAAAQTWEELSGLPEPTYKYKEKKGGGHTNLYSPAIPPWINAPQLSTEIIVGWTYSIRPYGAFWHGCLTL
jgi:hypothetical protein